MIVEKFPDRKIIVDNTKYLYFGGTSYLGINTHKRFQKTLFKKIKNWGSFYGSSRSSNIQLSIYSKFEKYFASFINSQKSLVISSGTLAGKLVLDTLQNTETHFYHYPKTHPAITTKCSKPLLFDSKINKEIENNNFKHIVICIDAILGGEVTPVSFSFLDLLPSYTKVTLVIDESHSIGILGGQGNGIFSTINHKNIQRKIFVSSLSKALGLSAGLIASDKEFIELVFQQKSFVSSSCANPSYIDAYLSSLSIYEEQRKKLQTNLNFLAKNLKVNESTFKFDSKYPVIYIENENIISELRNKKIIITNFKYPSYKNRMMRIVITANHKKKDLNKLINVLNKF